MGYQVNEVCMRNFGVIKDFSSSQFAKINLVIGENGTGKTFFLKAIYSAIRSLEEYRRGDDIRPFNEVLSEKLRWTFQVERLGDMVTKPADGGLSMMVRLDGGDEVEYQFTQSASSKAGSAGAPAGGKRGNSVFIPAKEVLSLFSVILKSREVDKSFGFDDTYYDLAKALRAAPREEKSSVFADSRKLICDVIDGKAEYDEKAGKWFYRNRRNQKFSIGSTSEGVKKMAIMDRLLSNGYLDQDSMIFIDEVESALHPRAVCQLLDMVASIADGMGIQVFLASHSYIVLKKLSLIAMKRPGLVSCISLDKGREGNVCDLYDEMPDNAIIDTSIQLYEQEIEEAL